MTKLPINQNIPLENDDGQLHSGAAWAWVKEGKWLYAFDKYWRKVPTRLSWYGGEFATEEQREAATPITAEQMKQVMEIATDPVNYDYLFNMGEVENDTEEEGDETAELPAEENAPTISVASPKWSALLRIAAKALNEMADALE